MSKQPSHSIPAPGSCQLDHALDLGTAAHGGTFELVKSHSMVEYRHSIGRS